MGQDLDDLLEPLESMLLAYCGFGDEEPKSAPVNQGAPLEATRLTPRTSDDPFQLPARPPVPEGLESVEAPAHDREAAPLSTPALALYFDRREVAAFWVGSDLSVTVQKAEGVKLGGHLERQNLPVLKLSAWRPAAGRAWTIGPAAEHGRECGEGEYLPSVLEALERPEGQDAMAALMVYFKHHLTTARSLVFLVPEESELAMLAFTRRCAEFKQTRRFAEVIRNADVRTARNPYLSRFQRKHDGTHAKRFNIPVPFWEESGPPPAAELHVACCAVAGFADFDDELTRDRVTKKSELFREYWLAGDGDYPLLQVDLERDSVSLVLEGSDR